MMFFRLAIALFVLVGTVGCGVQLPYLGKVSTATLCGSATTNCQPQQAPYWANRPKADFAWPSDIARVVVQKYQEGRELNLLGSCYTPAETSHYVKSEFKFTATLDEQTTTDMHLKVQAQFDALLKGALKNDDAKAHVLATVEAVLSQSLNTTANVSYTLYSPVPDLWSATGFQACVRSLQPTENVITGLGVVEISNQTFSETLRQTLGASVEASFVAEYQKIGLTGDAAATWKSVRNMAITNGVVPRWSYVLSLGWTNRSQYRQ